MDEVTNLVEVEEVEKGFYLITELTPVITEYLIKADSQEEAEIEYTHMSESLPSICKLVDIRNDIETRVVTNALESTINIQNFSKEELCDDMSDGHWLYIQAYSSLLGDDEIEFDLDGDNEIPDA